MVTTVVSVIKANPLIFIKKRGEPRSISPSKIIAVNCLTSKSRTLSSHLPPSYQDTVILQFYLYKNVQIIVTVIRIVRWAISFKTQCSLASRINTIFTLSFATEIFWRIYSYWRKWRVLFLKIIQQILAKSQCYMNMWQSKNAPNCRCAFERINNFYKNNIFREAEKWNLTKNRTTNLNFSWISVVKRTKKTNLNIKSLLKFKFPLSDKAFHNMLFKKTIISTWYHIKPKCQQRISGQC